MFLGYMFFSNSVPCNLSPLNFKLNVTAKETQKLKKNPINKKVFFAFLHHF